MNKKLFSAIIACAVIIASAICLTTGIFFPENSAAQGELREELLVWNCVRASCPKQPCESYDPCCGNCYCSAGYWTLQDSLHISAVSETDSLPEGVVDGCRNPLFHIWAEGYIDDRLFYVQDWEEESVAEAYTTPDSRIFR